MPSAKAGRICECIRLKNSKARDFQRVRVRGWIKNNIKAISNHV